MDLSSFYSQFRDEAAENVRVIGAGLLALDAAELSLGERKEQINAVFRAMHTIKGSARLLGFEAAGQVAHACEHLLDGVRAGQRELTRALADELLRAGDAILELVHAQLDNRLAHVEVSSVLLALERVTGPGDEPVAELPAAPAPPVLTAAPPLDEGMARRPRTASRQTVRVRVDRLDKLLNLAGELAVGQQVQSTHLLALEDLRATAVQQQRALVGLERALGRLRFSAQEQGIIEGHLNGALNRGEQALRQFKGQAEHFARHVNETKLLVEDLEQEVMAVRLVPFSILTANLPRAVRDLARETGKEIALVLEGETTELDRKVIEVLGDPIVHMLRNAADHGIEPPNERERAGKPAQGTITVHARAVGSHAHLSISDDGRGMDAQALRESAIRKGLLSVELAERLSEHESLELIFLPGFSTALMITDISGRGVGMDVVRTNVLELDGQVQIESQLGQGTTITLVLPLTLVTTRVLLVDVGAHTFALPATACQGTVWVYPDNVRMVEGRAVIHHEGRYTPVLRLADLLDVAGARAFPAAQRTPSVLIGSSRPLALLVDRLVDEREVVVKPIGVLMEQQRRYSGAIQFGDGRLILMLNPTTLAQVARGMALVTRVAARDAAVRRSRLLVADDSFTTRELISSILESAGYEVATAVDGLDALDKLRGASYDLVVSDVEMPRVDGFQLTARLRQELGLRELPVVIVTSLASEAHRRQGLEAGAQAYIVKSQFDQSNLLETIRQLLGS
ncbi:MAG: hybrid sensor histidine kinase/response regulator [Roseiflexaceae bacterium]|nr:hybrid sensor histidine kinase/response regulator [Roseiflexaceae bacterium]